MAITLPFSATRARSSWRAERAGNVNVARRANTKVGVFQVAFRPVTLGAQYLQVGHLILAARERGMM